MLNLQLYIEGQEVDLFQDESVTLTQTIQDVKDIEKVFTDYSRSFNVPASKTNNKLFKHFYNYHIIGYDARKKKDAELYLNYKPFKKGKIKLEGTTSKNNKAHTYKLTFFGNGINLKDLLGEDKLDALAVLKESFNFTYSDANIKTYMQTGLDVDAAGETFQDAIIFPLITHTKRLVYDSASGSAYDNTDTQNNIAYESGSTHGLQLSQLKPALRIHPIIRAIELHYGIEFSTDFFNTTNEAFYNLYLWLHNKTGGLFEDEGNVTPVGNFALGDVKGSTIDLFSNNFDTPQADQVGTVAGRKERRMDISIVPSVADEFNFIIYKNGEIYERYDNIARDTTTLEYTEIRDLVLEAGNYTFAIESDTPSTYDFRVFIERDGFGRDEVFFTATAEVLTDVQLRASNQLPDIKVIDFLTSLFKMFNLTSFQNDDGIIEVKTLDNFYSSSTKIWDTTEFIDKSESSVDSVLPYKQVNLRYDGQENFFAKNHSELFNQEWGTLQYRASDKFEGQSYTITVPLEHFKYERLKDINGNSFTDLQWGWSTDIKQEPNLGKPLLFYPIQQNKQIGVIESDGDLVSHTGVYIPSNSVSITASKNLNFNTEINEYGLVPYTETLFDQYYKNYVKEIFDPQRRLTTIGAYLPLAMTMNLSLADKIQIFENLYRINKISTNFETNKSTLELINIKEKAGETIEVTPIIPIRFEPVVNCFTADNITLTVDSTTVKVDASCNVEGLEVTSTNDPIPEDTAIPNVPNQNTFTPLIVTAPTLLSVAQASSTANTVNLSYGFSELGMIGTTKQIDEYGFFYSTTKSDLDSNNIDTLKLNSSVTNIPITTTSFNKHTLPSQINHQITGLSSGDTIYWKFYGRTNIDTNYSLGDAITDVQTSAVAGVCIGGGTKSMQIFNPSTQDSVTITYLNLGVEESLTIPPYSIIQKVGDGINDCFCDDSITADGAYVLMKTGDPC